MAAFRMKKFGRGPLPFRYVLLLTLVFFIFSTAAGLWIVNEGIKPTLVSYAESQTRKIAPLVINRAIGDVLPGMKSPEEIMKTVPDGAGGTTANFNTETINQTRAELARAVQHNLKVVEKGNLQALETEAGVEFDEEKSMLGDGIVYSVPMGQATKNALLGNLGPRIPIKFTAVGDVQTDVKTDVQSYGINNVFVVVSIEIEVMVQIIIPFSTTTANVKETVPVAINYLPGKVPQFYNGGGPVPPSIQLPGTP